MADKSRPMTDALHPSAAPRRTVRISPLGRMLVIYRASRDIGVRELSREMGFSAATLSRIERGYAMDWATALKLMQWLLGEPR